MHPDRTLQYTRIYRVQNNPSGPQITLVDEFGAGRHEVRTLGNVEAYISDTYLHDDADGTVYLVIWPDGSVSELRVNVVTTRTLS